MTDNSQYAASLGFYAMEVGYDQARTIDYRIAALQALYAIEPLTEIADILTRLEDRKAQCHH